MNSYKENIDHQLKMLDGTWDKFVEYGVTDKTELVLEFSYLAPNKAAANKLNMALNNYNMSIKSEGLIRKIWYLEGKTQPTTVTKEILAQWLDFMVAKGWEFIVSLMVLAR
jgi:hypothetical protein